MRAVNQSIGRSIRHVNDYRYLRTPKFYALFSFVFFISVSFLRSILTIFGCLIGWLIDWLIGRFIHWVLFACVRISLSSILLVDQRWRTKPRVQSQLPKWIGDQVFVFCFFVCFARTLCDWPADIFFIGASLRVVWSRREKSEGVLRL